MRRHSRGGGNPRHEAESLWRVAWVPAFAGMALEDGSMVATAKKVGEGRYRESFGRTYEDFTVGDIYEHRPGRTITETDNTWFTLLTMNTHPLHFDKEYAAKSEVKRPL